MLEWDVCSSLAPVQMYRVIPVCLLSWLKQHCAHLATYGQLLPPMTDLEVFYSPVHTCGTQMCCAPALLGIAVWP